MSDPTLHERVSYVVVKHGVYPHGTWGPYPTAQVAEANARLLAEDDVDDYHHWTVYPISPETGLGEEVGSVTKGGTTDTFRDARVEHGPT